MSHLPQIRIPATYLRGGTSKGVFFRLQDLPERAQVPGPARDALLCRVIGSPDPYGKHTDGMGGATSSTSKCVIISKSSQPGHDVDYLYGQIAISESFVDWSGNCGNLSTAVGPFAIANGFIDAARLPKNGVFAVKVWQANIGKTIVVHVPIIDGQVQEIGDFELDGVTFPAAEIVLEFIDPADEGEGEGGGARYFRGRGGKLACVAAIEHQVRSGFCEATRHGQPDALRRSGDECAPPLEVEQLDRHGTPQKMVSTNTSASVLISITFGVKREL